MNNSYFSWHGDPVLFEFGTISLPFDIPVLGILLAFLIIYFGHGYLSKSDTPADTGKRKRRARDKAKTGQDKSQEREVPALHMAGLVVGAFIVGILVFSIIPSPSFGNIGPVEMRWYGFLFAMAFIVGYFLGSSMFRHAGFPQKDADALLTYLFIGTIVGARLGEVIFYNPEYYLRNLVEIPMIWRGGLASHGAFIGVILSLWLYVRNRPHITYPWVLDRMTIPFAIGGSFVRIGNFFNSEIYGLPTEVSWAVVFERVDMMPRHPSMLYEALVGILLFVILWALYKKYKHNPPDLAMSGIFLVVLFTGRFLIEITKVEQADFAVDWIVGMGQLLSIPLVLAGLYLLIWKVDWKSANQRLAADNTPDSDQEAADSDN